MMPYASGKNTYGKDECGKFWLDKDGRTHQCIRQYEHKHSDCPHLCHCGKTTEVLETERQ